MRIKRRRSRGFSTTELAVVSMLVALLGLILSSLWRGLAVPSLSAAAQCRIAQEASFAAASLARDLGGTYVNPSGRSGFKTDARLMSIQSTDPTQLTLNYDHGANPQIVVVYAFDPTTGQLLRADEAAATSTVVAANLTAFQVEPYADAMGNTGYILTLTFAARDLTRIYQIVALNPSGS
jgi:hypothetical protein